MTISKLRKEYHKNICDNLLLVRENFGKGNYPNNADGSNRISVKIAWGILNRLTDKYKYGNISGQKAGNIFEQFTKDFLEKSFNLVCRA